MMNIKKLLRSTWCHRVVTAWVVTAWVAILCFLPPDIASGAAPKISTPKKSKAEASGEATGKASKTPSKSKSKKSSKENNPTDASKGEARTDPKVEDAAKQKTRITVLGAGGFSLGEKSYIFGGSLGTLQKSGSGLDFGVTRTGLPITKAGTGVVLSEKIHVGLRYRLGIAKLAYVGGGLGYSSFKGSWNALSGDAKSESPEVSSMKAVTFDGGFGVRLPLGAIVIGADLVDVSFPIMKMGLAKAAHASEVYVVDGNVQQSAFEKYAGGLAVETKLTLGFSF